MKILLQRLLYGLLTILPVQVQGAGCYYSGLADIWIDNSVVINLYGADRDEDGYPNLEILMDTKDEEGLIAYPKRYSPIIEVMVRYALGLEKVINDRLSRINKDERVATLTLAVNDLKYHNDHCILSGQKCKEPGYISDFSFELFGSTFTKTDTFKNSFRVASTTKEKIILGAHPPKGILKIVDKDSVHAQIYAKEVPVLTSDQWEVINYAMFDTPQEKRILMEHFEKMQERKQNNKSNRQSPELVACRMNVKQRFPLRLIVGTSDDQLSLDIPLKLDEKFHGETPLSAGGPSLELKNRLDALDYLYGPTIKIFKTKKK